MCFKNSVITYLVHYTWKFISFISDLFVDKIFVGCPTKNRSSHRRSSVKKGVVRILSENMGKLCLSARPATLLRESLAQVSSCEFSEISKNTFFTEHLRTAASKRMNIFLKIWSCRNKKEDNKFWQKTNFNQIFWTEATF